MAGIKISNATKVTSKDAIGNHLIPCATGNKEATAITVDMLFDYLEQNLGLKSIPEFSEAMTYKAPDIVKYNGLMYQFVQLKNAGPWDPTKAQQTSVFAQLTTLRMGDDEQVQVTIGSADNALNVEGLDVLLAYDEIKEVKQTDARGVVTFSVPKGKIYTLSVSQQAGYYPLSKQTYKALVDNRFVEFNFSKELSGVEKLSVMPMVNTADGSGICTPFIGQTIKVHITDNDILQSVVSDNGWALFDIPVGKQYRIEYPHVDGYTTPADQIFTAELRNRVVIPEWAWYVGTGDVLINCDDGNEYTYDAYRALSNKPEMLAIHVCPPYLTKADSGIDGVNGCDFYLPFADEWQNKQFCNQYVLFSELPQIGSSTSGDNNDVHFHYKGKLRTEQIIRQAQDSALAVAACTYCASKTLTIYTKGAKKTIQGFLGEFGQLWAIKLGLGAINAIRALKGLGNMNINSGNWWSASQRNASNMWYLSNGSPGNDYKTGSFTTVPLYA